MPLYDLMLLLDPTAPSDRHDAILGEVHKMLESGGTIKGDYDWGQRRLAFEIQHRPEATYRLVQFETAPGGELLERVDHSLKIMDGVLRHRIIRLKDNAPPPPMPRPEGRREHEGESAPSAPEAATPTEPAAAADTPTETAPAEPAAPSPQPEPVAAPAPSAGDSEAAGDGDETAPSGGAAA
jgi:small subunit ribosomal protein S6